MLSRDSSLNSKTPQSNVFTRNRQPSVNSVSSLERHGLSIERAGTPAQQNFHLSTQPSDAIQVLLLESALHMADISNQVKQWEIYQRWLSRVMEEFYNQGRRLEQVFDSFPFVLLSLPFLPPSPHPYHPFRFVAYYLFVFSR